MINMMSVDVEDWFQVHNLTQVISYRQWDLLELRVKTNTARILHLLDKHHTKATFFKLAERPGHERRAVATVNSAGLSSGRVKRSAGRSASLCEKVGNQRDRRARILLHHPAPGAGHDRLLDVGGSGAHDDCHGGEDIRQARKPRQATSSRRTSQSSPVTLQPAVRKSG